jgi:uncharacterized protein with GYD domain
MLHGSDGFRASANRTAPHRSRHAKPQASFMHGPPGPEEGSSMATYIVLSTFTDQGIRSVKDTTKRADAVKELARKMGIETKSLYWTVGQYDVVVTFEAPDDASITALALAISSGGNVRTQTLRAFSREEMGGILGKLG